MDKEKWRRNDEKEGSCNGTCRSNDGKHAFPAVISYHIKSYKKSPRNHLFSDGPGGILFHKSGGKLILSNVNDEAAVDLDDINRHFPDMIQ